MLRLLPIACLLFAACAASPADDPPQARWIEYTNQPGVGHGKHIVLIAGDEEYRSEEALPMLAQLLAKRHGFDCTVLFAQDPYSGEVDPNEKVNIAGLEKLEDADLVILFVRYREWHPSQMQYFDEYVRSGKPIIGLRTATHAFEAGIDREGTFANYAWDSEQPVGGFGGKVLGTTWVDHHGEHGVQSTRAVADETSAQHAILSGVDDIWCETNVYAINPLPEDAEVLLRGVVLDGLEPDSPRAQGAKFETDVPVAWAREVSISGGRTMRIFTTTMGSGRDFRDEHLRRLLINACYWAIGLEDRIPELSDANPIEWYEPSPSGFSRFLRGLQPVEMRRASRGVHRW